MLPTSVEGDLVDIFIDFLYNPFGKKRNFTYLKDYLTKNNRSPTPQDIQIIETFESININKDPRHYKKHNNGTFKERNALKYPSFNFKQGSKQLNENIEHMGNWLNEDVQRGHVSVEHVAEYALSKMLFPLWDSGNSGHGRHGQQRTNVSEWTNFIQEREKDLQQLATNIDSLDITADNDDIIQHTHTRTGKPCLHVVTAAIALKNLCKTVTSNVLQPSESQLGAQPSVQVTRKNDITKFVTQINYNNSHSNLGFDISSNAEVYRQTYTQMIVQLLPQIRTMNDVLERVRVKAAHRTAARNRGSESKSKYQGGPSGTRDGLTSEEYSAALHSMLCSAERKRAVVQRQRQRQRRIRY